MLVKHKLLVILALTVVSLIAVAFIGVTTAHRNLAALDDIQKVRTKKIVLALEFEERLTDLTRRSYQITSFSHLPYNTQLEELRAIAPVARKLIE
ncbi:MAG: hypothetical protein LBC09_02965, partial [Helicobacteraceae bacterium]|nr:hypothetical protein [Helicobacteraceae bacterium]